MKQSWNFLTVSDGGWLKGEEKLNMFILFGKGEEKTVNRWSYKIETSSFWEILSITNHVLVPYSQSNNYAKTFKSKQHEKWNVSLKKNKKKI